VYIIRIIRNALTHPVCKIPSFNVGDSYSEQSGFKVLISYNKLQQQSFIIPNTPAALQTLCLSSVYASASVTSVAKSSVCRIFRNVMNIACDLKVRKCPLNVTQMALRYVVFSRF
jgi:hypothetical protein